MMSSIELFLLRWDMSTILEGPCKTGPLWTFKHHLSCHLIVFNLALSQQSCLWQAVWNDKGFHSFKTRAGDFIKQYSAWTFWNKLFWFLGLAGFLSFPETLCALLIRPIGSVTSRGISSMDRPPWHQTLVWYTKFTKTFGTLAWLTLEKNTLSPQLESTFLTSKRLLVVRKEKHICATASGVYVLLWYTVECEGSLRALNACHPGVLVKDH